MWPLFPSLIDVFSDALVRGELSQLRISKCCWKTDAQ
jgi:hypothetical protein